MQKLEEPKQMRKERSSPLLPVTASGQWSRCLWPTIGSSWLMLMKR